MKASKVRAPGARGYFGIGIFHTKTETNVGTLMRSAYQLGAAFVFTIGRRYTRQASDTVNTGFQIPLYHYENWFAFAANVPDGCRIVGIEMGGIPLDAFAHPAQAVYILGAEDNGLPVGIVDKCWCTVEVPAVQMASYNVAVAGSIVMYDRLVKSGRLG